MKFKKTKKMNCFLNKCFLLLFISTFGFALYGQNNQALIQKALNEKASTYNLSAKDVQKWEITDSHQDKNSKISYYYLTQKHDGLLLHNAIAVVVVKDQKAFVSTNRFVSKLDQKVKTTTASIAPKNAILTGARALGLSASGKVIQKDKKGENHYIFDAKGISKEEINLRLKLFKTNEKTVRAVWDLDIYELDKTHWWSIRIDAQTGTLLDKVDWVSNCNLGTGFVPRNQRRSIEEALPKASAPQAAAPQSGAGYNVFPIPIESPIHGSRSLIIDPADPVASPYGWHDTDGAPGAEHTETFGNNVYASEDHNNNDMVGYAPDGGASLDFNFPLDLNQHPHNNVDAAVTNLFYMNNIMHDIWYQYGFDEASGNFQKNNYGNGGLDDDHVFAQAQDGGGMNNANFATPPDNYNPTMQMYLWTDDSPNYLTVNSPSDVSGPYSSKPAGFGPAIPTSPITADLVLYDDNTEYPIEACSPAVNGSALNGKIAVIRRGNCNFTVKVQNAENAGAVAVIMVNNVGGAPITMGGTDPGIGIPSLMVSMADGEALITKIQNGSTVNATIQNAYATPPFDGDFDNGVIAHEYGHGISNRLTGGSGNSSCLGNDEQMGEGWSDWFALMITLESGDQGTDARGIGTYVSGETPTGGGIRPTPYSTDGNINNTTYAATNDTWNISKPHGIGYVWATMLWDMTWKLIDRYGFDPDFYNGTGGNNIAMHLVIEGLKLQPCEPGFIDGRDAILLADEMLYNGQNRCLIWEAFANRGLGFSADQGSSDSRTDQTEAFDLPSYIGPSFGSESVTTCGSYTWPTNNQTYSNSGTYKDTIYNAYGCDSIVTLNLTIEPQASSSTSETVCDSYTWGVNGVTYSTSGVYTETFSNGGCDSIVTLNLTVNDSQTSTIHETICGSYTWSANGQTYTNSGFYTETLNTVNGCDSIVNLDLTVTSSTPTTTNKTVCNDYTWSVNNQTYINSGTYTDTLSTTNGCDSIVILNLTVNHIDTQIGIDTDGVTLVSPFGYSAYQWIDCDKDFVAINGANNSSYKPTHNGNYAVVINDGGCTDTSSCLTIDALNLNAFDKSEIKIYPNPTNGMVNIDFINTSEASTVKVYDMIGKLIQTFNVGTQKQFQFPLKGENGVYTIEVKTQSGSIQRRKLTKLK